jgi:DNA-binding NarL/FixJ family response regulator
VRVSCTTLAAAAPLAVLTEALSVTVVSAEPAMVRRVEAALDREGVPAVVEAAAVDELRLTGAGTQPHVIVVVDALLISGETEERDRIRRRAPDALIVAVVRRHHRDSVRRLLNAGADAIVLEHELELNLGLAIRSVCAGHVTVPRELRHGVVLPALSYRERQILGLVAAGLTNDEIAGRLFLSESTVKGHLTSAFRRLGVRSRREAVAMILASEESLRRSVLTAPAGEGVAAWR